MASYQKFSQFIEDVFEKVHNCGSDTLKVMLTNVAPVATNSVKADLTEIAAGNGYTAGGVTVAQSSSAQTSGTYKLVIADATFTASGGSIADFRYAVLYNSTAAAGNLISFWDYGATITVTSGNSFTVDLDQVGGVFTAA
jgi:hypothetical protein